MSYQSGTTHDDAFAGESCFRIMGQCVLAHFLFYFKPPGLLPFLLRNGFVNINRHMSVNRLKLVLFSFQQELGLSRL